MSYRGAAERVEDGPDPLQKGPAKACPACTSRRILARDGGYTVVETGKETSAILGYHPSSPILQPRACTPDRRLSLGWFFRCKRSGAHLHERCRVCGLQWLTSFAEG